MPFYHTNPTHGVQCADSVAAERVEKKMGPNRLDPPDAFGTPARCVAPALSNESAARWPKWRMLPKLPVLIIASSDACFERARRAAEKTNMVAIDRVAAVYTAAAGIAAGVVASSTSPSQQPMMMPTPPLPTIPTCDRDGPFDGVNAAHRRAWAEVVQANKSMAILEEDAEPLGDAADVRALIERCHAPEGARGATAGPPCDLAYLGVRCTAGSSGLTPSLYPPPRGQGCTPH